MTRRLVWPSLRGGATGPSCWELYDGTRGAFTTMSLDALRGIEADLRAAGEVEMADAFDEQLAWLVSMAEIWRSTAVQRGHVELDKAVIGCWSMETRS